jgi:hypothetical protein
MPLLRLRTRFAAWLAIVALLLGALVPMVTQAMVRGGERDGWLQICSVSGMVWVQTEAAVSNDQPPVGDAPLSKAAQHCAWCTLHGGAAGVPVADRPVVLAARLTEPPPAFFVAPPAASIWLPAQSRAPPLAA